MTPEEQMDLRFKDMQESQLKFERETDRKMQTFMATIAETLAESPVLAGTAANGSDKRVMDGLVPIVGEYPAEFDSIQSNPIAQLPLSFRYRNDGTSGTHRLEYIFKPTPYSSGTNFWPNDEWTAIPGADAEIYTP